MRNNRETFQTKIANGRVCVGINISLTDATISEIVCDVGYDFTWLDAEHGPLTIERIDGHIARTRGTGTAAFVRVLWNDPVIIKPVLELEPAGVIIPMVSSVDEAEQAVRACKYPPRGVRGFGPRRGNRYGAQAIGDYLQEADSRTLVIIQLEQAKALEQIDDILAVDGLDAICIGPMDLSASMGLTGQIDHPRFRAAVDHVASRVRQTGIYLGWATGYATGINEPDVAELIDTGFQWISLNADWSNLRYQSSFVLERLRAVEQSCHSRIGKI